MSVEWAIRCISPNPGLILTSIEHRSAPRSQIKTRTDAEGAVREAQDNSGYLHHTYEVVYREVSDWKTPKGMSE